MSDFFTHLVGQVLQPAADVLPAISVRFAPGADLTAGGLAPEPPAVDALYQPFPQVPAQNMSVDPRAATRIDPRLSPETTAPAPAHLESRLLPTPPGAEVDARAPHKAAGVDLPGPAHETAPPKTLPGAASLPFPAEKDGPAGLRAQPSGDKLAARENIPTREPPPEGELPDFPPKISPRSRPEPHLERSSSTGPGVEPGQSGGGENKRISIARAASSEPPPQPLGTSPVALGEPRSLAAPANNLSEAVMQPPLPQSPPRTGSKFPPEIPRPEKPVSAETKPPASRNISAIPSSTSPVERLPEPETAAPHAPDPSRLEAVKKPPAPDRVEPEPVRAAPPAGENLERPQPQSTPRARRAPASPPQPSENSSLAPAITQPAALPGPNPAPGKSPPVAVEAPPAVELEGTAAQRLIPTGANPPGEIRPVLKTELPLEKNAPSARTGSVETAFPTLRLTIGRIVVKAAPPAEPAVSRPAAPRRQPAVSLTDYLNRHGGSK